MKYMLIWRKVEVTAVYFAVPEDAMISPNECKKVSIFLLQLYCHRGGSTEVFYGHSVKHKCSKKLSLTQWIYLLNGKIGNE